MLEGRSIICFGGEDWFYHHPHSKTHLMKQFARAGNKVIFVNSISMGLPSIKNRDLLPKIGRKLRSYAKLTRTTPEGITIVSPPTLPFHGNAAAGQVNKRLLVSQIGRLARRKGMSSPILWIAIPTAANIIGKLNESVVIYQVSDKYDANTEDHAIAPAKIREMHEYCINHADIVLYSGRKLLEEATLGREKSYLLEQAVDFDHWARVRGVAAGVSTGNGSDRVRHPDNRTASKSGSPPYEGGVDAASADGVVLSVTSLLHIQRQRSELAVHSHEIELVPGLDDLAVLYPHDDHSGKFNRLISRSDTDAMALMNPRNATAGGNLVILDNGIFDQDL